MAIKCLKHAYSYHKSPWTCFLHTHSCWNSYRMDTNCWKSDLTPSKLIKHTKNSRNITKMRMQLAQTLFLMHIEPVKLLQDEHTRLKEWVDIQNGQNQFRMVTKWLKLAFIYHKSPWTTFLHTYDWWNSYKMDTNCWENDLKPSKLIKETGNGHKITKISM